MNGITLLYGSFDDRTECLDVGKHVMRKNFLKESLK